MPWRVTSTQGATNSRTELMDQSLEQWRPVVGYEGLYEVSDQGRIWSHISNRYLKLSIANTGYHQVNLKNSIKHVHRLVLEAFVGPCPESHEGCHANGNRIDNRLCNLRWDTRKGNMSDAIKHGTTNRGGKAKNSKLNKDLVLRIKSSTKSNREIAKEFNISREHARDIRLGKRWSWVYL